VTTNNGTPQVYSDGARDDGPFGREWPDEADGAADAEPYQPWFSWDAGSEPAAGDGYPQPSFYPAEQGYPADRGYADGSGYPREPEYPQGPGFAPLPPDHPGPRELGYPAGPGYAPDAGYAHDLGYPHDGWNQQAPEPPTGPSARLDPRYVGYAPEPAYGRDQGAVPPMESLLEGGYGSPQYQADHYQADQYHAEQYEADQYQAEQYEADQHHADQYEADQYEADPYQADPYQAEQSRWEDAEPAYRPGRVPSARSAQAPAEAPDGLSTQALLRGKRSASGSGWRHRVSRVTGGLLRLGESAADMRRRDLINRVRTPVAGGHHRVAVLSLKGGVGKTTTAVGLGATFATLRGDRVIAVDANPDRGTLSDKVRLETAATVRDLLNERDQIRRYADVRAFTTQAPSRLEVLASDRDPAVSVAFSADDYCDAAGVLEHFYSICLTDCGTGLLHSAMAGVLALADQIVVVSSPSVDGARSASATLDWLEAHRCGDLVRNGVVVLSTIRPRSKSTVDLDRLEQHFAARCRAVARIPYDPHLEEGAEVDLELLTAETADAYLTLAALVGDGLAWPRRLTSRAGLP
jgi:MinD-like ATPase involved in chromosome partitioning or flagellar assembly